MLWIEDSSEGAITLAKIYETAFLVCEGTVKQLLGFGFWCDRGLDTEWFDKPLSLVFTSQGNFFLWSFSQHLLHNESVFRENGGENFKQHSGRINHLRV